MIVADGKADRSLVLVLSMVSLVGFPVRTPAVALAPPLVGMARSLSTVASRLALSPVVKCALISCGSGKLHMTGMASKGVEEMAEMAWVWCRLCGGEIANALGTSTTIIMSLGRLAERQVDLMVHVSPGDSAGWKTQILGAAIAVAMVSLMTGRQPVSHIAVMGELLDHGAALGGVGIHDPSAFFRSARSVGGITSVVVSSSSLASLSQAARREGVALIGVERLSEALGQLFPLPTAS